MIEKREIIERERTEYLRVFKYTFGGEEIAKDYHIYLIDCRGEKDLVDVIKRIDELMDNKAVKEKETVQFPIVFSEIIKEVEPELKNIIPVINNSYRCNYITGVRKVESNLVPGYFHNLHWVGLILSMSLKNLKIQPGYFDYNFTKLNEFLEAYVPKETMKFLNKVNAIKEDGDIVELRQFFSIAKKIRPELLEDFKDLEQIVFKKGDKITNDIQDYLLAMDDAKQIGLSEK